MTLVAGDRLADRVRRLPALPDRLRLFDRICDVVAFAHARGVVHRDLKPANIMVGAFGEVRVLDWGLARRRDTGGEPGSGGSGTEGYMAPEQAAGHADSVPTCIRWACCCANSWPHKPRWRLAGSGLSSRSSNGRRRPMRSTAIRTWRRLPPTCGASSTAPASRRIRESALEHAGRLLRAYRTPLALMLGYLAMRVLLVLWR